MGQIVKVKEKLVAQETSGGVASVRILTLHQPWASLAAWGMKTIETRSFGISYRGAFWIHAASSLPEYAWDAVFGEPRIYQALRNHGVDTLSFQSGGAFQKALPMGEIVGAARMAACKKIVAVTPGDYTKLRFADGTTHDLTYDEEAFGWYEVGRYCWVMEDITLLPTPVKAKGFQGLWMPTPEVYAAVTAQLTDGAIRVSRDEARARRSERTKTAPPGG